MARLRFWFEYGVDAVLWPDDVDSELGYPCDLDRLPVSVETRARADLLAELYQSSLNDAYPPDPTPWTLDQQVAFNEAAQGLMAALRKELEPRWTVEDCFTPFPAGDDDDTGDASSFEVGATRGAAIRDDTGPVVAEYERDRRSGLMAGVFAVLFPIYGLGFLIGAIAVRVYPAVAFVVAWETLAIWQSWQFGWRCVRRLELTDRVLRWQAPMSSGELPLSRVRRTYRKRRQLLRIELEGGPTLVIYERRPGMAADIIAHLSAAALQSGAAPRDTAAVEDQVP